MTVEFVVRTGPETGPIVLFILPIFDEANRMRRTVRLAMAHIANAGVASLLPDLPGTNESLIATRDVALSDWRDAIAAHISASDRAVITASFRGGCLIDAGGNAAAAWRCAPAKGINILRTMLRTRIAADKEAGMNSNQDSLLAQAANQPLELAGNSLSVAMVSQLQVAQPSPVSPCRTVSINPENDDADGHITGSPLWLRAEPGEDTGFAHAIAADILSWGHTCGII